MNKKHDFTKSGRRGGKALWKGVSKAKRRERAFMMATRRWAMYRAKKELDNP